ncbi:MAG: 50S ribosomal protein L6 [Candidatus Thermoplasmatota archaeon]|nr:50S ribosomal protein L6 [Candidatus Thermoplasmatota archaeon]
MVKHYFREEFISPPDDVMVSEKDHEIKVDGPKGTLVKSFYHPRIQVSVKKGAVRIYVEKPRKKDAALFGTYRAHLNNMIKGVTEGFEYGMKIVYSHFPMKTTVKKDGFIIENFLGEAAPRKAKIVGETKVQISGDEVTVKGLNKEEVGQTAANIELATYIKHYDPRVFQDGIYIVNKG